MERKCLAAPWRRVATERARSAMIVLSMVFPLFLTVFSCFSSVLTVLAAVCSTASSFLTHSVTRTPSHIFESAYCLFIDSAAFLVIGGSPDRNHFPPLRLPALTSSVKMESVKTMSPSSKHLIPPHFRDCRSRAARGAVS